MTSDVEKLRALVVERLGVKPEAVVDDAPLAEGLGADALDNIELVMAIEDAFNVSIADVEVDALQTFGDLRKLLADKLRVKAAA